MNASAAQASWAETADLADFLDPPLRCAEMRDAADLAAFINMAGEGLPLYLWTKAAASQPSQSWDPWAIGRARQAAKIGKRDIIFAEDRDGAIGALFGYAIGRTPHPTDDVTPLERPLIELENEALGSWYVNVLAVAPERRRQGWARRLLDASATYARATGAAEQSIIVADRNEAAFTLYRSLGFVERARRMMVKELWWSRSRDWVLLVRPL